jgi:hypothetical protein
LWRLFVSVAGGQVGGLASYIEAIAVVAIGFVVDSQHDDVRNGRMNQGEEGHKQVKKTNGSSSSSCCKQRTGRDLMLVYNLGAGPGKGTGTGTWLSL